MTTTMNISLPDEMKAWIEAEARGEHYSNTSDFMRDLVRREQERRTAISELRALIDEGLSSGVSSRSMEEIFDDAMAEAEQIGHIGV